MKKLTIYIDHVDDDTDFQFMLNFLERWKSEVRIENYSSGGWEHIWNLEGPENILSEIPEDWHCSSDWATPEIFSKK